MRKRKARMKISRPRRTIAAAAGARRPVRSAVRVADNTTARPASDRNIGAAKPPMMLASRYATLRFAIARVHASVVCASIIISTAMPRAQSMYARLEADVMGRGKRDVLPHRVPDRAIFFFRQGDGAFDRVPGDVAVNGDVQRHADDAVRLVLRPIGDQMRP